MHFNVHAKTDLTYISVIKMKYFREMKKNHVYTGVCVTMHLVARELDCSEHLAVNRVD